MIIKNRLAVALASAVFAVGTILAPPPATAGPALYYLICTNTRDHYSPKMSVTRSNVMSCPAASLWLFNDEAGTWKKYDGLWCIYTGQRYTKWTGWQILGSNCKGWLN